MLRLSFPNLSLDFFVCAYYSGFTEVQLLDRIFLKLKSIFIHISLVFKFYLFIYLLKDNYIILLVSAKHHHEGQKFLSFD